MSACTAHGCGWNCWRSSQFAHFAAAGAAPSALFCPRLSVRLRFFLLPALVPLFRRVDPAMGCKSDAVSGALQLLDPPRSSCRPAVSSSSRQSAPPPAAWLPSDSSSLMLLRWLLSSSSSSPPTSDIGANTSEEPEEEDGATAGEAPLRVSDAMLPY